MEETGIIQINTKMCILLDKYLHSFCYEPGVFLSVFQMLTHLILRKIPRSSFTNSPILQMGK